MFFGVHQLQHATPIDEACQLVVCGQLTDAVQRITELFLTLRGLAAPKILAHIEETKPLMVVMGTHGHTGWRHALLGSVAERVVRAAPCSVLTTGKSAVVTRRRASANGAARNSAHERLPIVVTALSTT